MECGRGRHPRATEAYNRLVSVLQFIYPDAEVTWGPTPEEYDVVAEIVLPSVDWSRSRSLHIAMLAREISADTGASVLAVPIWSGNMG